MKLEQMSAKYNEAHGVAAGFLFKSKKTGKVFKTLSLTPSGKFLVCNVGGSEVKEQILRGDADLYDYVSQATEAAMKRGTELKAELKTIDSELETLEASVEAKYERRTEIENELDGLDFDTTDYDEEEN